MSINFSQFPTPTLPINAGDFVVGYQNLGTGGVPTLAQYTMTQLAGVVGPIIGGLPPSGPAGGDLSGTYPNPTVSAIHATSGSVSGAVTGVTGVRIDNTTSIATNAFVNQQIASSTANVPFPLVGGVYNQASLGTGASFVIFSSGGVIGSVLSVVNGGAGYAVGDLLLVIGGNYDAVLRVTNVSGGVIQSGGLSVIYGGTGYGTGATTGAVTVPPGQRTVTFTGVLTSNVTFIIQNGTFLTAARRVQFNNNTTGAFTVTVKLSNGAGGSVGSGVVLAQGTNNSSATLVETDGVNDVWLADTPLGIGAVPITGNSTITGNIAITGSLNSAGNDALLYRNTSAQSFASGTTATVTTWTSVFDRLGTNFNASTGVFTAPATGIYHISAGLFFAGNTGAIGTSGQVFITANAVQLVTGIFQRQTASNVGMPCNVAVTASLTSGQQVIIQGLQNTGGAVALTAGATGNFVSIHRVA